MKGGSCERTTHFPLKNKMGQLLRLAGLVSVLINDNHIHKKKFTQGKKRKTFLVTRIIRRSLFHAERKEPKGISSKRILIKLINFDA